MCKFCFEDSNFLRFNLVTFRKKLTLFALTKLTFEKINFLEKLAFYALSKLIFNLTLPTPRPVKATYRELHR
jgi:hypothetical protein